MHSQNAEDPSRSLPRRAAREDHHLWKNGHVWWLAVTLRDRGGRRARVRRSLRTYDVAVARGRRDVLLDAVRRGGVWSIPSDQGCQRRAS